jgi:D-alanyl-D-alanine carboxypeptidase
MSHALRPLLERAVTVGGVPGIAVELSTGWFGSAGSADSARRREDHFRIGSITKSFVATVLLQLAAEGVVDLDESVGRWVPGLAVTVRQVLNHTSGLFNYTADQQAVNQHEKLPPELLVRIAAEHPPEFAPGTGWAYSNTNYIVAGLIIERSTGRTVADEIERRISRPLHLAGTYLPAGDDHGIRGPHPRHYTRLNNPDPAAPILDATSFDPALFWSAGAMISTTGDLIRFFQALLAGELLPPPQQREMLTTVPTVDWLADAAYGLGISSLDLPCGGQAWGMGGATFGSWTFAYGTPDGRHMLVANVNGDWTDQGWDDPIGILTDLLHAELCAEPR